MAFRVSGLGYGAFAGLFGLGEAELAARRARREVVTHAPGFPCRVSLRDAAVGEEVLLVQWVHQPATVPFCASQAVYVRRDAVRAEPAVGEVPEMLRCRLLSVRAFDPGDMMVDADVVEGVAMEGVVERMFAVESVAYLQVHTAKQGCYLVRVDRA